MQVDENKAELRRPGVEGLTEAPPALPHPTPEAPLTGVRGLVLAVPLQLKDVYFHSGLGWDLDDPIDLFSSQGQGQTLTTATHGLVVQDCS